MQKKHKGQGLVELALILPILILILMGTIEFGFMFNNFLAVHNGSREIARHVSLGGTDAEAIARGEAIMAHLDVSQISVAISPSGNLRKRGDSVEVVVVYQYQLISPVIGNIVGNGVPLRSRTVMRVE